MAYSDSLFLLIKSLTKAEKRHFKLSMSGYQSNGEKLYLQLFDAIDMQQVYDEKAIKKKFKNQPYFNQLARIKIYLHQQILKSLRNLYDNISADMKLNNMLSEIELLYKRELLRDCLATIKKAKVFAEKHEKLPRLLLILAWEAKVTTQLGDVDDLDLMKRKWLAEEKDILVRYNELLDINQLGHDIMSFVMKKGEARAMDEKDFQQSILNHELMQRKMMTFHAELEKQIVLTQCLATPDKYDERYNTIKQLLQLIDDNPHQMDENLNLYVGFSIELIILSLNAKKFEASQKLYNKLVVLGEKRSNEIKIRNKLGILHVAAALLLAKGDFKPAIAIIDEMNLLIGNGYELNPIGAMIVHSMQLNIYFLNRNFGEAHTSVQKILHMNSSLRADFQTSARCMNLILQYELGEFEHLQYLLRSTSRFLEKKQRLYEPEAILIDFIKKAIKNNSAKQTQEALQQLRTDILPFIDEPFIIDFPLLAWIDSKLQKKDLREVVMEQYQMALSAERKNAKQQK